MRKTYAWNLFRLHKDIHLLKLNMNHKYTSTTMLYIIDGIVWLMGEVYTGDKAQNSIPPMYTPFSPRD